MNSPSRLLEKNMRILAAVMFTDIVGYSRLMQENERNAKSIRDKHRSVLEKKIEERGGIIIQYYGDGSLSIFSSAVEAVKAAESIQKFLLEEPKIPVRIGIHLGDIVYDDEGVYGDAVNIASRLESLSCPGGILVSNTVYFQIKNQPDFNTISLGLHELKNISEPVEIFAIVSPGLPTAKVEDIISKTGRTSKTVAVLPFVNMSSDPENEYFSDGITEELLNSLAKVEGLRVTARTSSFAFKGKNIDIREIGRQLNANAVLEGSVRKAGNRVRITAQLIDTQEGYHIFSDVYDRTLDDIFEVQDEIALKIANELRSRLGLDRLNKKLSDISTENLEAYNLFLKGKFYWRKFSYEGFAKSIEFFQEAIKLEPNFAMAYAWLSNSHLMLATMGYVEPQEGYTKAKELANLAISLDENNTDAIVAMALLELFYYWDWRKAKKYFDRAMKIAPDDPELLHAYSVYWTVIGKPSEAVKVMEKAYMLDPLSPIINSALASSYFHAGRFKESVEYNMKALELDPNHHSALYHLILCYIENGEPEKALGIVEQLREKVKEEKEFCPLLALEAYAQSKLGNTDRIKEIKHIIEKNSSDKHSYSFELAIVNLSLGDKEKALDYLEKAYEERNASVMFLKVHLSWMELSGEPRFKDLLKKMNLS